MGFEVVGLPHYVIWHVYEPSEDDLIRMDQMERDKAVMQLDTEDIDIAKARWDKDRKALESVLEKKKTASELLEDGGNFVVGGIEGPVAHVGEEGVAADQENGLTGIEEKLVQQGNVEQSD
jgi:hypothetical protein